MDEKLTPMLQQYYSIKRQHPDVILLFRLGDFYEMFGEDAQTAAPILDVVLTGREAGAQGRIPMCGVPHHSVDKYIARLVAAGHRVAICDQVEDPRFARGLVRRKVTRVVTPGTVLEDSMLDSRANNYLAAVAGGVGGYGLAVVDISTGEFLVTQLVGETAEADLLEELQRLSPAEVLVPAEIEGLDGAISAHWVEGDAARGNRHGRQSARAPAAPLRRRCARLRSDAARHRRCRPGARLCAADAYGVARAPARWHLLHRAVYAPRRRHRRNLERPSRWAKGPRRRACSMFSTPR